MERTDKYEFNALNRYVTKGIAEQLPNSLVIKLWSILDDFLKSDINKDYLQVFKVKIDQQHIEINHFQEEPSYTKKHLLKIEGSKEASTKPIEREIKIYIIDDVTHSTMLLAEEY
jgi:site-specific DNA-adenine methylase